MRFDINFNQLTGEVQFSGSYTRSELNSLNLRHWDRKVLDGAECSPADSLLALELIYRRHAEQAEAGKAGAQ